MLRMAWLDLLGQSLLFLQISLIIESCPDRTWKHINSNCFKIMNSPEIYDQASSSCQQAGGELLPYESRHILMNLNITSHIWLGKSQKENATSEFVYSHEDEQRNITLTKKCPRVHNTTTITTSDCNEKLTFVCLAMEGSKGIHIKLIFAVGIAGAIFLIFMALVIYSAKSRFNRERQNQEIVIYGKYIHLHQDEDVKLEIIRDHTDHMSDKTIVNKEVQPTATTNGDIVEESVRIKNGKFVQFSLPSAESEQMLNVT